MLNFELFESMNNKGNLLSILDYMINHKIRAVVKISVLYQILSV